MTMQKTVFNVDKVCKLMPLTSSLYSPVGMSRILIFLDRIPDIQLKLYKSLHNLNKKQSIEKRRSKMKKLDRSGGYPTGCHFLKRSDIRSIFTLLSKQYHPSYSLSLSLSLSRYFSSVCSLCLYLSFYYL